MINQIERLTKIKQDNAYVSIPCISCFVPLMGHFNYASVVDVPANPPNCLGSTFDTMVSSTHSMTIDSNTFAAIGVSDIGRMSLCIEAGGLLFGNGMTLAIFHSFEAP